MRMLMVLVAIGAFASVACAEDPEVYFTGPGWYQISNTIYNDREVVAGPFADQASCNARLQQSHYEGGYDCLYREKQTNEFMEKK